MYADEINVPIQNLTLQIPVYTILIFSLINVLKVAKGKPNTVNVFWNE